VDSFTGQDHPEDVKKDYLALAASLGYDVASLIWVEHDK
jgi:lipocalin